MDPLVHVTARIQEAAVRLVAPLVALALGGYLVWSEVSPRAGVLDVVALVLLAAVLAVTARFRGRRRLPLGGPPTVQTTAPGLGAQGLAEGSVAKGLVAPVQRFSADELGFYLAATDLVYALVLRAPGGLGGPYAPLAFVLVMVVSLHAHPVTAGLVVALAGALEALVRSLADGQGLLAILPRVAFLAAFAALSAVVLRAEISRIKRVSRGHVQGELARMKDAARAYRLTDAPAPTEEVPDRQLASAAGEFGHSVRYSLDLLSLSLSLDTAVLYSIKGSKLVVFEALTRCELTERALSTDDGVFSACLRQRETICVADGRASRHAIHHRSGTRVGALAVVPLFEGHQPRGVLVVDREVEAAFSEREKKVLEASGAYLLRAMENERRFGALSRASHEQSKLYRAAQALAAATTEASVIEAAVESAREVASFDFAAVTLFHKKTATHEICAVSGDGADGLVERTFRHNAGLVSMVVANRHPLPYRGEYEPTRQTVFARGIEPPKMPSLFVLPLMVHERVLGTLVLGSSERGAFSESVRPTLEVLASHMAVSLSNARMLARLEEQATTDGMTGLLNKRTLIAEAEKRIASAARFKKPLSVLVTDVDHFKRVNDTYGHDVGDIVIKGLGDILRRVKRDTDIVGRFGGEEFVVVCEETDEEGAKNLAERIRKELSACTFQTELGPLTLTCSVGVAPFPAAGQDWAQLFKATDEALYVSKRAGRDRVTVWTPRLRGASAA